MYEDLDERHCDGERPVLWWKNFQKALAVENPQKLAIASISNLESARRLFAFSRRTNWISFKIEWPAICRKRISAIRREQLNTVSTSVEEIPSQARLRISSIAVVTSAS